MAEGDHVGHGAGADTGSGQLSRHQ